MYRSTYNNVLLRIMKTDERLLLEHYMERISLPLRMPLECRGQPIEFVYFPESGIATIVARIARGRDVEVGLIGFEGMTGAAAVFGDDCAAHECFMQMAGEGVRVPVAALRREVSRSPQLHNLFLRYAQSLYVQATYCALCNVRSKFEERLAQLLLRCHDRVPGGTLPLTHQALAVMLGVRRPVVTLGLHVLEGEGLIRANRGEIVIRDRERLIKRTRGGYDVPAREYRRLIGIDACPQGNTMFFIGPSKQ
ncbi:Crp/Fnr family transcriptional regulator [Pseudaminobacter sp. 19-2017]|uniref:Crp/Fnr family transcriptional regulator n=1 Tax=Pseudaminobacter soli (ex Zhang et al. 2022) TaxID=2831468 RepID=A0A942I4N1_9HYPH|nr:Crp/Fnr family transcriptional regulator [Pseudaminobacter soli]MBS3651739.1 Crp/Fnr family transcriptional regulator [Pseudaminobacter soli]